MSAKAKQVFVCTSCGENFGKWMGRCTNCGDWGTVSEFRQPATKKGAARQVSIVEKSEAVLLSECKPGAVERITTGYGEVDQVLGGGLVPGSLVLIGGAPGIGKSTLVLQVAAHFTRNSVKVLYISGEESVEQLSLRAKRLSCADVAMTVLIETSVERMVESIEKTLPDVVIVDSVQTMFSEELESAPGSVSQIRESTALLMHLAKSRRISLVLIGHVTKEGAIAGPRVLEHMVDTVLYFEGDNNYQYRILRSIKNRFGPSGEIAVLVMGDNGLKEVTNTVDFFLLHKNDPLTGTAVAPVLEGTRIVFVELQALVNRSHFGLPQRVATGINPKRLSLLIAVLERYTGISLGDQDIFFNIAGGLTVSEPAIDCGIVAALCSSFRNKPIRPRCAFIGELGLGGEIRPVNNMAGRIRELSKIGFKECIIPKTGDQPEGKRSTLPLTITRCASVRELVDVIF